MRDLEFLRTVIDEQDTCSYLPEQVARLPLCVPTEAITLERMDQLLASGYRRNGAFFYRTQCEQCNACEPTRLAPNRFAPSRSQKRVWKKNESALETRLGPALVDEQRVRLFNAHRSQRKLDGGSPAIDRLDYQSFLLNAACEVFELSFWLDKQLIAVSITDVGANSLSAVYCFFDPNASKFSPGTYSILKQIDIGRQLGRQWLYLGLYVAANRHLNYKARFQPHQRLVRGAWQEFGD